MGSIPMLSVRQLRTWPCRWSPSGPAYHGQRPAVQSWALSWRIVSVGVRGMGVSGVSVGVRGMGVSGASVGVRGWVGVVSNVSVGRRGMGGSGE